MRQAYDYNVSAGMRQAASEPHLHFVLGGDAFSWNQISMLFPKPASVNRGLRK